MDDRGRNQATIRTITIVMCVLPLLLGAAIIAVAIVTAAG